MNPRSRYPGPDRPTRAGVHGSGAWPLAALLACLVLAPAAGAGTAETLAGVPSPSTALTLSLLGTAIPIGAGIAVGERSTPTAVALILGGVIVGPSAGFLYGDCHERGLVGVAWRAAVTAVGGGLIAAAATGDHGGDLPGVTAGTLAAIAILGTAALGAMVVTDLVQVRGAVARRGAERGGSSLRMAPANVGGAPGLALAVRF